MIDDKVGVFGTNLSIANLSAFEIELSVDDPTGGFLFTPDFLTDIQRGILKNGAKRIHGLDGGFLGNPGLDGGFGPGGIAAVKRQGDG